MPTMLQQLKFLNKKDLNEFGWCSKKDFIEALKAKRYTAKNLPTDQGAIVALLVKMGVGKYGKVKGHAIRYLHEVQDNDPYLRNEKGQIKETALFPKPGPDREIHRGKPLPVGAIYRKKAGPQKYRKPLEVGAIYRKKAGPTFPFEHRQLPVGAIYRKKAGPSFPYEHRPRVGHNPIKDWHKSGNVLDYVKAAYDVLDSTENGERPHGQSVKLLNYLQTNVNNGLYTYEELFPSDQDDLLVQHAIGTLNTFDFPVVRKPAANRKVAAPKKIAAGKKHVEKIIPSPIYEYDEEPVETKKKAAPKKKAATKKKAGVKRARGSQRSAAQIAGDAKRKETLAKKKALLL